MFRTRVQVSGTVYGEDTAAKKAGETRYGPLHATVTCNDVSTETGGDGSYSLSFDASDSFKCTTSASSKYAARTVTLKRGSLQAFHLSFYPAPDSTCRGAVAVDTISCPPLTLQTGTLRGTVTGADDGKPKSGITVQCWNTSTQIDVTANVPNLSTQTNADGLFTLRSAAVGPYGCVVGTDRQLQRVTVGPGAATRADLQMCEAHCPSFNYDHGVVMHTYTVYLIFWLPRGKHYEPQGSDGRFEGLVQQYFQDIGGSDLYKVATQYWDYDHGPMLNSVTLAGTYMDTQPYPHAGTTSDPLTDQDVRDEISRVTQAQGWRPSSSVGFFVVTGFGVNECGTHNSCTFSRNDQAFCAYHSYSGVNSALIIYSYIPVVPGCDYLPTFSTHPSPHGDRLADAVLSSISHEHFESATDPLLDGWFSDNANEGEVADLCVDHFGVVGSDGSNVTLSSGHRYILQSEWSLADSACVLGLT
ncbi:MAG TPA: carboxypeptidase regulatory-like domain-containing protein [Ktedonobacterales bacterium]|nr:carboxypeptidase regulatory-like domain-containing protein [Ktedonobacterales bacterium]